MGDEKDSPDGEESVRFSIDIELDPDDADENIDEPMTDLRNEHSRDGGLPHESPRDERSSDAIEGTDNGDRENRELSDLNLSEKGSLFTGWSMITIAIGLFILALSIYLFGLETVFTNKKFPDDTDTPCYLSFLVMGVIFLILGIVYRDMAVHPEFFEEEIREKSVYLSKKEEWERIKRRVKEQDRVPDGSSEVDEDNDP